jgi:hypothetical protein
MTMGRWIGSVTVRGEALIPFKAIFNSERKKVFAISDFFASSILQSDHLREGRKGSQGIDFLD